MRWLTANFLIRTVPLALGSPAVAAETVAVRSVQVEGTVFRVTLGDGRILPQDQLPGAILAFGDGTGRQRRIRIDAVERDPKDPAGEVMLYTLSEQDPATGKWNNLCLPDPDGRRLGFPLAGAFTPDGRYERAHNGILLTCTGGAEGKCIRFGYRPLGLWAGQYFPRPLLPSVCPAGPRRLLRRWDWPYARWHGHRYF
jgi:ADYC domain